MSLPLMQNMLLMMCGEDANTPIQDFSRNQEKRENILAMMLLKWIPG